MSEDDQSGGGFLRSRAGIGLLVFGAIAAFFVITEHQAHLWGWLPFLLLLACPLMHLFMHGRHAGHADRRNVAPGERSEDSVPGRETHQHHDTKGG